MPLGPRRARSGRVRSVVAVTVLAYAIGLLGWHGARFTSVGKWWPFELLDVFGVALYVPLALLLVVWMLAPTRAVLLGLATALVLFGWEYGGLFIPRSILSEPTDGVPLRVMTANLLVGNANVAAIGAMVLDQDPDVVALQELGHHHAAYLAGQLRDAYPHQVLEPHGTPFGVGLISRHPLRRVAPVGPAPNDCSCLLVTVEHAGRSVVLLNVHPPPPAVGYARLGRLPVPTSFRNDDTEETLRLALELLDGVTDPGVVLGDFNVGDRQPFYREVRRGFRDAHREAGWGFGFTFPNLSFEGAPPLPLVRIDYILHDERWIARAVRNGTIPGSDHRYVVADLVRR